MSELLAASRRVDAALDRPLLLFLRHGETDWNRALRFQGQRDVPLNEIGRRQAARNGRAIAGILRANRWRLVASPLGRSIETMQIALEAAKLPGRSFATDPALKEAHYGDWEGLTLVEIGERHADAARAREANKWSDVPPNGESYAMVAERVSVWLQGLEGPTFIVAHGGILRALLRLLASLPPHDAPHLAVPQDRAILFTRERVLTL